MYSNKAIWQGAEELIILKWHHGGYLIMCKISFKCRYYIHSYNILNFVATTVSSVLSQLPLLPISILQDLNVILCVASYIAM